jgi:hypothetical protein
VYFRAPAYLKASVAAVFPAASIHNNHAKHSKGWRKNVEAIEHLRGLGFVVLGSARNGAVIGFD